MALNIHWMNLPFTRLALLKGYEFETMCIGILVADVSSLILPFGLGHWLTGSWSYMQANPLTSSPQQLLYQIESYWIPMLVENILHLLLGM